MTRRSLVALPSAFALLIVIAAHTTVGCDEEYKTCYPGDYLGCTCPNGQVGFAACSAAGGEYGQCVCDGTTPGLDAGTPNDAAGTGDGGRRRDGGDADVAVSDATSDDARDDASDAGDAGDGS